jgi:hypothetical protein
MGIVWLSSSNYRDSTRQRRWYATFLLPRRRPENDPANPQSLATAPTVPDTAVRELHGSGPVAQNPQPHWLPSHATVMRHEFRSCGSKPPTVFPHTTLQTSDSEQRSRRPPRGWRTTWVVSAETPTQSPNLNFTPCRGISAGS